MEDNIQLKTKHICKSFKRRRPLMEDNLKISKVEYLSNRLFDPTQTLNLSFDAQNILYKFFLWRRLPMEDDIQLKTISKY